jgi:hypothetical protein
MTTIVAVQVPSAFAAPPPLACSRNPHKPILGFQVNALIGIPHLVGGVEGGNPHEQVVTPGPGSLATIWGCEHVVIQRSIILPNKMIPFYQLVARFDNMQDAESTACGRLQHYTVPVK